MKIVTTLILALLTFSLCAQNTTTFSLSDVNEQWKNTSYQQAVTVDYAPTETDKINIHLQTVIDYLNTQNISHLTKNKAAKRANLIKVLHTYALAKNFPINEHKPYRTPIFIDNYGTHCAVGYLMQRSGSESLARQLMQNENLAFVKQIKTAGVDDWATENGFTVDELALIQPSYSNPLNQLNKLNINTTSPIQTMVSYHSFAYLLMPGSSSIVQLDLEQFNPPYSPYRLININFPSTTTKPENMVVYKDRLYVATKNELYSADFENFIWKKENIIGPINNLSASQYGLVVVGNGLIHSQSFKETEFSKIQLDFPPMHIEWGIELQFTSYVPRLRGVDYSGNVMEYSMYEEIWQSMIEQSSDFIPTNLASYGEDLIKYSKRQATDEKMPIGLFYNYNEDRFPLNSIFDMDSFTPDWHINNVVLTGNRLFVMGKFIKSNTITTIPGKAIVELTTRGAGFYYPLPISTLFEEVYNITMTNQYMVLSTNLGVYVMKHSTASIPAAESKLAKIYPNPISNGQRLKVETENIKSIKLMDHLGRQLLTSPTSDIEIPMNMQSGIYICFIETKNGSFYNQRLIVE